MRMKRTLLVAGLLLASATACAAELTLFSGDNFGGERLQANDAIANLANSGFNDRASSLRIENGYWMFCSDANFGGSCRTFGPGDYPNLPSDLDHRISSGRRIADRYPYEGRPTWSR